MRAMSSDAKKITWGHLQGAFFSENKQIWNISMSQANAFSMEYVISKSFLLIKVYQLNLGPWFYLNMLDLTVTHY